MFNIFIYFLMGCMMLTVASATLFTLQLIIERFILRTLPVLADLYMRIRYPAEYLKSLESEK